MLHELLFALSGVSGGIFVDNNESSFQVVKDLPFLHPSENEILNNLCKLGWHFQQFERFIKYHNVLLPGVESDEGNDVCGLYLQALSSGLNEVLKPYRQALLELEQEILNKGNIPLTFLQYKLEKYQLLFPALTNTLDEIKEKKAKGCAILTILYSHSANGIPFVKEAYERMLFVCHGVMYKQLSAWLLHGLLLDYYDEFFIMKSSSVIPTYLLAEEIEADDQKISHDEKPGLADKTAQNRFMLNAEMLPNYISTIVAEKILFVGESVKMLESAMISKSRDNRRDEVMKKNEIEFGRSLNKLQREPLFHLPSFEKEIDRIKSSIAQHLWSLVVEEGELLKHLKLLKDFYLLGRGELFRSLIEKSKDLLKVPPTSTTALNIKTIFDEIVRKILPDEENDTSFFSLSVKVPESKTTKEEESSLITGWHSLKLHYDVQWPLHVVFTPSFLEKFNGLFIFLVNIRRTQMELQNVWTMFKGRRAVERGISKDIWLLRMEMTFLVDNLQYYLQVDVLEAQYSILFEKINSEKNFEILRIAHDNFITTLQAQSFLLLRQVYQCLNEILELCQSFCAVLISHVTTVMSEREHNQIEIIRKNYARTSSLLLKLFSGVRSHQASPHLAQFLLRIDFNRYLSSNKSGLY